MAKSTTKAPVQPTAAPVMVNKGLPWILILGISAFLLLAGFGLWSGISGASDSFFPSFSIFWLLGTILLASGGWMIYKLKIVRGLILILLALVAFQIPGTTSGPALERKVVSAPATLAEKGGNLLVTGTTKSPAQLAAEKAIEAEAEKQLKIATRLHKLLPRQRQRNIGP